MHGGQQYVRLLDVELEAGAKPARQAAGAYGRRSAKGTPAGSSCLKTTKRAIVALQNQPSDLRYGSPRASLAQSVASGCPETTARR